MNFGSGSRGRKSRLPCNYPCALQLYKLPPTEVVSLQDFEEMAEKRLRRKYTHNSGTYMLRATYKIVCMLM